MIDWNDYPNFTEKEFLCQCGCGRADMDQDFMDRLAGHALGSVGFALARHVRLSMPRPQRPREQQRAHRGAHHRQGR